jgi:hypothetical protein
MQHAGARRLGEQNPPETGRARPRLHLVDETAPRRAERRTVTITGNPDRVPRRRSPAQAHIAARPDRVALWAFLLGLFLVAVAAATAHAAPV